MFVLWPSMFAPRAEVQKGLYARPMSEWPPCGLYRTSRAVENVPSGRLVYFHDHGEPGPGMYLPSGWHQNKARFHGRGQLLTPEQAQTSLEPLLAEGFYCVVEAFHCCDKQCRGFEPGELIQLGYDAQATPILFSPQWQETGLELPASGLKADPGTLTRLSPLRVAGTEAGLRRGLH
jgi:hypothetical protein